MKAPGIERSKDSLSVQILMDIFPITAILGPRQAGKTTLAKAFQPAHIFDLENPRDMVQLENPLLTLEKLSGLIMIDEIQRKPDLFPVLRFLVDNHPDQKYLILGSASSSLKQQSGESLAGRIGYYYLTGFNLSETGNEHLDTLWERGGFPRSYLAANTEGSIIWRNNFISTFLERDLALLDRQISSSTMFRFWVMLSHYHGQVLNYSELGRSFGISDKTVKRYIAILEDAFMIRILLPWHTNVGKRLVKRPKLYIRDSGIFHSLQSIRGLQDLRNNPKIGASWEGFALEEIANTLQKRDNELFFYAAHGGVEIDLFWQDKGLKWGVEYKYMDSPKTTKSMHQAIEDLGLTHLWVVYPGDKMYSLTEQITVTPLKEFSNLVKKLSKE